MPGFVRLGQRFGCDEMYFSQLVNWGTFTAEEFARRAVHLPAHPQHARFVDLLQDTIFDAPGVDLGNLTHVRHSAEGSPADGVTGAAAKLWNRVRPRFFQARSWR
jgi:hypothetical protein